MARRPRIRSGAYRDRYRLESLAAASGAYVSGDETWSEVSTFRAETKTLNGTGRGSSGETENAGVLQSINTLQIVTHYSAALAGASEDDRLVDVRTGKILNIRHIDDPDRRKEVIWITAEEGRPNG